ncbi:hypothetical protein JKP88DRAFT_163719, partial [Tribonema minus]
MGHNATTRRLRGCWGFDAIRAIDQDDPALVLRAYKLPFADVDHVVQKHLYGDYAFTQRMDLHEGDTALHLALKWRKMRAAKALLHLNARWDIVNAQGVTAEAILMKEHLKPMLTLKAQQEREYATQAMACEDDLMHTLLAHEQSMQQAMSADKLRQLNELRTAGAAQEAMLLMMAGRIM